jgi:hypothetical protein
MKRNCVATSCGIKNHGVNDSDCVRCATGQTWYPYGNLNYCQIEDTSRDCA